jgi:hypothetical protein
MTIKVLRGTLKKEKNIWVAERKINGKKVAASKTVLS